jgi:lipopolysaccharide biosynthesis regulator YciM
VISRLVSFFISQNKEIRLKVDIHLLNLKIENKLVKENHYKCKEFFQEKEGDI